MPKDTASTLTNEEIKKILSSQEVSASVAAEILEALCLSCKMDYQKRYVLTIGGTPHAVLMGVSSHNALLVTAKTFFDLVLGPLPNDKKKKSCSGCRCEEKKGAAEGTHKGHPGCSCGTAKKAAKKPAKKAPKKA